MKLVKNSLLLSTVILQGLAVVAWGKDDAKMTTKPPKDTTIMFIPIDDRFTTRDAFLNMAQITPYRVLSPPRDLLSRIQQPAPLPELHAWIDQHIEKVDAVIVSLEMYLYGGLINSRRSNTSTEELESRLEQLLNYKRKYPNLGLYIGTVVMRIPSYNGDFEEPWYWNYYGADIYTYSYYLDKYHHTDNKTDLQKVRLLD